MAFSKKDNEEARKWASSNGFRQSSADSSKMINNRGDSFKNSSSGGSWNYKGSNYTSLSDLKKSKK